MDRVPESGQWKELFAAFDLLVELNPAARAERLDAIGASDPAVRRILEEMLEADSHPSPRLGKLEAIFQLAEPPSDAGTPSDMLRLAGETFSHFHVLGPLASGGMGVVYRGVDTRLERPVALKFPLPEEVTGRLMRERFLREARAVAALEHPNICTIYEAGETEKGHLYLAMPLYEGETLKQRLARSGRLPIHDAVEIAMQVARGLQAAHSSGIVHSDLKPANVMLLADGGVRILDFGVARVADITRATSQGALGTAPYMAPEQVRGESVDARTDLWGLGVLLYEMIAGRRPFTGGSEVAVVNAIIHSVPVHLTTVHSGVSRELNALVLGLLSKNPEGRHFSAGEVAAQLSALPLESTSKTSAKRSHTRRRSFVVASGSVLLLVITAAGIAWLIQASSSRASTEPRLVAVLPRVDSSAGVESGYLTVALASEIAASLSRLRSVAVTGAWAFRRYSSTATPKSEIVEQLGVDAVVRVGAERRNDAVVLQVEAFDAEGDTAGWRREYGGPLSSVMEWQRQATEAIVSALDVDITREERAALNNTSTASIETYDLYLRGRAAQVEATFDPYTRPNVPALQQAESFFARARERDPDFAASRASLASAQLALAQANLVNARRDQARLEAETALRLQPGLSAAHEALATYWMQVGNEEEAVRELQQALAGRPNSPDLHSLLGVNFRGLGRWDEAVSAFERASRLDPGNRTMHFQAALTLSRLRQYAKAIAHWDRVIAMDSTTDQFPRMIRAFAYLRYGELDSLEAGVSRIPLTSRSPPMVAYLHFTAHRVQRAMLPPWRPSIA